MGPARVGQDFQGVFLCVGVEVTDKHSRGAIETLSKSGECSGLLYADSIGVTLPVTIVSIRGGFCSRQVLRRRSLGLEVVGNDNKVLAFVVCISDRLEFLSQGLTREARVCRIVVNDGVADRGDLCLLVNEGNTDDVFVCRNG